MNAPIVTRAQAELELMLLNADVESIANGDLYLWLRENGLPSEVAIRLEGLIDQVVTVGNSVISIGKIVLMKIMEFVKAHPNLAIGIAVGAAIGALVSMVPFLGVYLAPIAMAVSTSIGAIACHRLDKIEQGQDVNTQAGLIAIGQDAIEIAKEFFQLLFAIFNAVFAEKVFQGA